MNTNLFFTDKNLCPARVDAGGKEMDSKLANVPMTTQYRSGMRNTDAEAMHSYPYERLADDIDREPPFVQLCRKLIIYRRSTFYCY